MKRLIPQNPSTEKIQYKLYGTLLNILKLPNPKVLWICLDTAYCLKLKNEN